MPKKSLHVFPYQPASESARNLANALGVLRIAHRNSRYKGNKNKTVINWGASKIPDEVSASKVLNHPDVTEKVSDKVAFFKRQEESAEGARTPESTTDPQVAATWVSEGETICIRKLTNSSGAKGLVIVDKNNFLTDFCQAKLYTKYKKKRDEYRVHVGFGKIFDIQRKALRHDYDKGSADWKVRNHDGGFIFQRENVHPPENVLEEAIKAFAASELDFGAVDVIWNEKEQKAYVLEINTAPGLTGTTLNNYVNMFKENLS